MTITSMTVKEYFVKHGDNKSKYINMSMPYSLREPPATSEECGLRNEFAAMLVKLDLFDNFTEGLEITKRQMD